MSRPTACEMRLVNFSRVILLHEVYDFVRQPTVCEMGSMMFYELPYCMRSRIL